MAFSQNKISYPHEDFELFREMILYTSGETGFNAGLVEKDYYCSLLLDYLYKDIDTSLVFKGGTCLSKVYTDFYRLSEDIDFAISTPIDISRPERRERVKPIKKLLASLSESIFAFSIEKELRGHNESTQYIAYVKYTSVIAAVDIPSQIKIEIGMREELLENAVHVKAKTLINNPFTDKPAYNPIELFALTFTEAYAEKIRAALTRKMPAIRDFYDIYFAVSNEILDINDRRILDFVKKKIHAPGNDVIDLSLSRKNNLKEQFNTQLKPVLRKKDFQKFDLNVAVDLVTKIGNMVL